MNHRHSAPHGRRRRSFHIAPARPRRGAQPVQGIARIAQFADQNPAVAVTLVGILVYAIAGFAHLYFYGSLGVSLDEVGLGYSAILSKAALVLALALLVSATVLASTAFIVLFFIGAFYSTDSSSRKRRLDNMGCWGGLIILVMGAAVFVAFIREPVITVAALFSIVWLSAIITSIRLLRREVYGPSPLEAALAGAIMLWIVLASSFASGFALRAIYGGPESVPPVWYWLLGLIFIPLLTISYLGLPVAYASWHKRHSTSSTPSAQRPVLKDKATLQDRLKYLWRLVTYRWRKATDWVFSGFPNRRILVASASLLILVSIMSYVARIARYDLQRVMDGRPSTSLASQVVHSPITCVAFTWLEDTNIQYMNGDVLYLGRADGRVVLYVPTRGPVRLPAASVALSPAGTPDACVVKRS
jgi:hypothetical protein